MINASVEFRKTMRQRTDFKPSASILFAVEGLHGGRWRNDSLYQGFLSCIYGGRWQQTSGTDPEGKLWK